MVHPSNWNKSRSIGPIFTKLVSLIHKCYNFRHYVGLEPKFNSKVGIPVGSYYYMTIIGIMDSDINWRIHTDIFSTCHCTNIHPEIKFFKDSSRKNKVLKNY